MNNQDLDRLIDTAAEQLVWREPSSALTDAVMARVRASQGTRSSLWFSSAAALAVIAVIAVPVLSTLRVPRITGSFSTTKTVTGSDTYTSFQPAPPDPSIDVAAGPPAPVPVAHRQPTKQVEAVSPRSIAADGAVMTFLVDDPILIDPIVSEPIDIAPIVVAVSQPPEPIQIAPLVVEPLSSSND